MVREVGDLARRADAAGRRLPTLGIDPDGNRITLVQPDR